jgi:DNA-binding transcriptional LysR family regulator
VIECDSYVLQKQFVEEGLCIGRLPSYYVDKALQSGKLIELFPDYKRPITSGFC